MLVLLIYCTLRPFISGVCDALNFCLVALYQHYSQSIASETLISSWLLVQVQIPEMMHFQCPVVFVMLWVWQMCAYSQFEVALR